jgi:hypothetical protein
MMRRTLINGALALSLAFFVASPATLAASKKKKHSAEHIAAIKKCNADYTAAAKATKSLKGKERNEALAKAKADRKQCIANAPK